jgi:two-component system phosphate regulon sensor histidine kinase PhoR
MIAAQSYRSLTQRLSEQYFLFGLAGLFCFVLTAVYLSLQGSFLNLSVAAIGIPLGLLLIGSFALRRTSHWHENIERQLTHFANGSADGASQSVAALRPLPSVDPFATGWNQLLARVKEHSDWNGVERRLSEALHSQQAKRWEGVFQNLSEGIAICDSDGQIIQLNRSFATLLKRADSKSLVGLEILSLLSDLADEPSLERIRGLNTCHATQVIEINRSSDLSQGVWRLSRIMQSTDSSNPGDSIWTLRDITQQKLAEKAREQFVFTATHELRTPLANIRAYAETLSLAGDIPPAQQQEFYNTINNEATRLARFVDELLNISQMEAGAITIEKHEIQLDRLLDEILASQRPMSNEKKQTFDYSVAPKLPKVIADKDKLASAITNLVSNAIKYTPEGGKVTVKVDADASRVLFIVEDSGIGISAEDMPKLCSKFFRSSDERVRAIVGSGLGLAFSQEVARLHGGNISIRSQLNQGSCFTLELPIR